MYPFGEEALKEERELGILYRQLSPEKKKEFWRISDELEEFYGKWNAQSLIECTKNLLNDQDIYLPVKVGKEVVEEDDMLDELELLAYLQTERIPEIEWLLGLETSVEEEIYDLCERLPTGEGQKIKVMMDDVFCHYSEKYSVLMEKLEEIREYAHELLISSV